MATPHIQFRIFSPSLGVPDTEQPVVGEPFWDPVYKRLGIYSDNNKINWFASIADDYSPYDNQILATNASQMLGGLVSQSGVTSLNKLAMDFSTPDEIRIIDRLTRVVYARFTPNGALFNSASVQGTTKLGIINNVLNAGLNVKRNYGLPTLPRVSGEEGATNSLVLAPNWQLWCAPGRTGILEGYLSDDVPFGSCPKSMQVKVPATPAHAGIRTFLHNTTHLAGKVVNFSFYVKGPVGKNSYSRAISTYAVHNSIVIEGNGAWSRQSFNVTIPSRSSLANFIAFDMLYNPIGGETVDPWYVAAPQIALGNTPLDIDIRPQEIERSLVSSIYSEGKRRLKRGDTIELNWDLMPNFTELEVTSSVAIPITITEKDHLGAILELANIGNSTDWVSLKLVAHRLPYLEETLG